jgi:hypothetical protein
MRPNTFFFLITILTLTACSLREAKEPQFSEDNDVLFEELRSLRNFEHARVKWDARTFERKTLDVLVVELVNGKGMVDDETELRELGKQALKLTVASIENESEYERLEVIFIRESRRGVLTNTYTRSFQYAPEDLN